MMILNSSWSGMEYLSIVCLLLQTSICLFVGEFYSSETLDQPHKYNLRSSFSKQRFP